MIYVIHDIELIVAGNVALYKKTCRLTAQTEIRTATRYTLRRLPNASTCRAQPISFQRPGPNDHTAHCQRYRLSDETYLLLK